MAKPKTEQFAKWLYVRRNTDNDGMFYEADTTIQSMDDGDEVAVYELKEVHRARVIHELVPRERGR